MLINKWALSEEERTVTRARVKALLVTYRRGTMNKDEIDRYFNEWMEIATRLHKGAEMLDSKMAVQERSKQHMRELEDLYAMLLKLLGMYDEFFKRMFGAKPERHQRAQAKILRVLKGEVT